MENHQIWRRRGGKNWGLAGFIVENGNRSTGDFGGTGCMCMLYQKIATKKKRLGRIIRAQTTLQMTPVNASEGSVTRVANRVDPMMPPHGSRG